MRRRAFLKAAGITGMALVAPEWLTASVADEYPEWQVRTVEKKNFAFEPETGTLTFRNGNKARHAPYTLDVDGLVETSLSLSYQDLRDLPSVTQISDLHCVEGWSQEDITWGGFRMKELVRLANPSPRATHVVFHALGETRGRPGGLDHYVESHPLSYLLAPENECIMALDAYGQPLPLEHGSPLRLAAPRQYGYKSIKFVTRIEFTGSARPGWWSVANPVYPVDAPVGDHRFLFKRPPLKELWKGD